MIFRVVTWTVSVLSLFSQQCSYDAKDCSKHIEVVDGKLIACINPKDKPFKKGSDTFPRSELRFLDEQEDGRFNLTVEVESVPNGDNFSLFQLFGSSPLVMVRKREGELQVVSFDGKPKIQVVKKIPRWCVVQCGRKGYVDCDGAKSEGRIRCNDKLHFKVGIYSQQVQPAERMCAVYGDVSFERMSSEAVFR